MPHYYSEYQDSKLIYHNYTINLKGTEIEIVSATGIFSSKKLDRGTEILIKYCLIKKEWENNKFSILDLGCGCGVVGVCFAKLYPNSTLLLSDVNKRAVKTAKLNIEKHKLKNAKTIVSDKFERIKTTMPEIKFDLILHNPPQSAGKDVCIEMIQESINFLNPGGYFQIVARHNKGGKVLSEKMFEVYGNVRDVVKKSGYRVYLSEKQNK